MTEMRGSMSVCDDSETDIDDISVEEAKNMLDQAAWRRLGMSGEEFRTAWDEGRLADQDNLTVMEVAALLPGVR